MTKKDELKNSLKGSLSNPLSTDDKELELERLMGGNAPKTAGAAEEAGGKEKIRVTLDFSRSLARKVKTEAASRDQTMKGFIVELLNRYFEEKISK
jgi:hypothetical protein